MDYSAWGESELIEELERRDSLTHTTMDLNYPCDICGKPAVVNVQECVVRWAIVDDDLVEVNPEIEDAGDSEFFCAEHE